MRLKASRKSFLSQQYMIGFIAELLIAIVIPKFLIISVRFAEMSKYFRGLVTINDVQKMKKKNKVIPIARADPASFRNCCWELD